jgi:hypothetical protein
MEPYIVTTYPDWTPGNGTSVGFQTEQEARRFASLRPEPLIDLIATEYRGEGASRRPTGGGRVIATRRMHGHPAMPGCHTHDDFPDTRD